MYKIFSVFCICLLMRTANTAVGHQPPIKPPAEFACQDGCYSEEFNRMLPVNVPFSPADGTACRQYTCKDDGWTDIYSCGVVYAPNCTKTEDLYKTYPDCCPQYTCPPSDEASINAVA